MMNKRIRMMIDEIFSEMKMTAENLALRDELMANALDRYEDAVKEGRTPDEAFIEVAASLGDVQSLLAEMNAGAQEHAACGQTQSAQQETEPAHEEQRPGKEERAQPQTDLGDALNKAFEALGDFGQTLVPQAKKLVQQMDVATGGMIKDIGKAAHKGLRDAQKAAEETINKLSGDKGELVFDFGPKKKEAPQEKTEQDLRREAEDLRAGAAIKDVTGDAQGAQQLRDQADALDMQADALEQAQEIEKARKDAQPEEQGEQNEPQPEPQETPDEPKTGTQEREPLTDENGEISEDAFAQAVDQIAKDAENVIRETAKTVKETVDSVVREAEYVVRDADAPAEGHAVFPAAGLHKIDIKLDADDVCIEPAQEFEVQVDWTAQNPDSEPAVSMQGHTLTVCRKNPDVFKTFFSVFKKEGGRITIRVPMGCAAAYSISTTSGDVTVRGIDADDIRITTTSGCARVEPVPTARAKGVSVTTVSGHATVSACAEDIAVTTVSGDQFVSCDAKKVDVNVVSGKVHVEGACDEWEVDAVSSDVELLCTVAPTKMIRIASMHGMVRLALPSDIRGFAAETSGAFGCEIVNEFGANRYGTCALPIRMETMRGQLMITRL